jgi:hypothetical protein
MAVQFLAAAPAIVSALADVVDRFIPNPAEAAKAKLEMEAKLLVAATAQAAQQTEINKIEAGHASIFVAGWRPYIGWVCGMAIAWAFLVAPMLSWLLPLTGVVEAVPPLQTEFLLELVFAMLGLGGFRTFEKLKGVASR